MSSTFSESEAGTPPESAEPPPEKKRSVFPVHPLFFVMFPFLAFYAQNFGQSPLKQMFAPMGEAVLKTAALWLVFFIVTRQARKAALAASIIVVPYYAYGHIAAMLPQRLQDMPTLLIGVGLVAIVAMLVLLLRARQPLYDITSGLNVTAFLLLLPSTWTILVGISAAPDTGPEYKGPGLVPSPTHTTKTTNHHLSDAPQDVPDVYYIVLDAYGRADRLQTYYGYDNTPFLQALEARGFFIARQSEANYDQTPLCLASALGMNYLEAPLSPEILRKKVDENAVVAFLRTLGYHYIDVASGLEVSQVETADMVLNDEPELSTVDQEVAGLTAFGALAVRQKPRYDHHRARLLGGFSNMERAAALPYPKFVFTHILAPHPPFVFGPNGEALYPKGPLNLADASDLLGMITKDEYRQRYIAQLQYVNKRTLEAIDSILKQSRHRPIIILQGDHGSRMSLDWESLAKTDLREPFSNLNAYLVPDNVRRHLTEKITAVNSFRILLTEAFGAKNLPRLPDRNFYSTEKNPYDFIDVTARLAQIASADSRRYADARVPGHTPKAAAARR